MKKNRTHQTKGMKVVIVFIALFCIVGAITFADKATDLYKALDATLNVATGIDLLDFKELDEAIAALEVEISKLDVKILEVSQRILKRTKIFEIAKKEYNKAKKDLDDVNSEIASSKKEYESSSYYHDWYLKAYMNHTASCDFCYGSVLCSEAQTLHDNWQTYSKKMKKAKKDWDAAKKKYLPTYDTYYTYWRSYVFWKRALSTLEGEYVYTLITKSNKTNELEAKREEKKRLKTLRDNIPTIQSYITSLIFARRQPDFDFDKWLEANPIPSFLEGELDF